MDAARKNDAVDQRLANLEPYQRWAQVLSHNLRRFRKVGYDVGTVAELRASAED